MSRGFKKSFTSDGKRWKEGPVENQSIERKPQAYGCTGPVRYVGQAEVQADIANLKAAMAGKPVAEAFIAWPGYAKDHIGYIEAGDRYRERVEAPLQEDGL